MTESSGLLLELIAKAKAIAEEQQRPTVVYLLSLAADVAIDERPPAATERAETRSSKRRWRWAARGRFLW